MSPIKIETLELYLKETQCLILTLPNGKMLDKLIQEMIKSAYLEGERDEARRTLEKIEKTFN